jgi:hypothetical protein
MCTGTMTLRPVSVWHVLPRAQLQSSRRAFATARRRRPGGSHLPGRATRTMRGDASLAAAAASTAALCARRHGPARGAASSARRHPKDAAPRALLGYRSRRTTAKMAAGASDDVFDEGKSIRAFLSRRVSRVAARVSPTTRSRRTVRGGARSFFSFFISFSDVCPTVTTTRQRKGRSERARARDAAAPISRRRCPSRALSRDDETPSREHETRVGKVFNPSRAEETPPRTRTLARRAEFYRFPRPSLTPSRTTHTRSHTRHDRRR